MSWRDGRGKWSEGIKAALLNTSYVLDPGHVMSPCWRQQKKTRNTTIWMGRYTTTAHKYGTTTPPLRNAAPAAEPSSCTLHRP